MKRLISIMLSLALLIASLPVYAEEEPTSEFNRLNDEELMQYICDSVYASAEDAFESDDYSVTDVDAIYISREYLEELDYNSKENIFFGYSLAQLNEAFDGGKYVFFPDTTTDRTSFKEFENYELIKEETVSTLLKNVAIGTGVILVCVTVSVLTGGAGTPSAVHLIFAASAKSAATCALSSAGFGAVSAGVVTGVQTGNFGDALNAAIAAGSEGFKWGAIGGAVQGGIQEAAFIKFVKGGGSIPTWHESEERVLRHFKEAQSQKAYFDQQEVPYNTIAATRPDIIRWIGGHLEAIEIKNYNLIGSKNRTMLYKEISRQVQARIKHMPGGTTQRIVLDVTGRGYTKELINTVVNGIKQICSPFYPDIPVDVLTF